MVKKKLRKIQKLAALKKCNIYTAGMMLYEIQR